VGGPGGTRHLPHRDTDGTYHVDGVLHVADKPAVRDLISKLTPRLKTLGPRVKKVFLSPLTRYWIRPCCSAQGHLTNYNAVFFLPNLGVGVYSLREFIRDSLYVRRASNFRVICLNRMLNIHPGLTDEEAREVASLWGDNPVHPSARAYCMIANKLEEDLESEARFTNPRKEPAGTPQKKRSDLSLTRQPWVDGCSAALPRGDVRAAAPQRGSSRGSSYTPSRGHRGGRGKYRPYPQHWRKWCNKSSSSGGSQK
jgi:hypothetical protein